MHQISFLYLVSPSGEKNFIPDPFFNLSLFHLQLQVLFLFIYFLMESGTGSGETVHLSSVLLAFAYYSITDATRYTI